jgi:hypothetical protein
MPVIPEYDHSFAGEGKDSGCERLIGRSRNRQSEGKANDGSDTHGSNLAAEPKSVGRISITKLLLDYPAQFLLTGE